MVGDTIGLEDEMPDGFSLIEKVMGNGKRSKKTEDLQTMARYTGEQLATLPAELSRLDGTGTYPVRISDALLRLKEETERRLV